MFIEGWGDRRIIPLLIFFCQQNAFIIAAADQSTPWFGVRSNKPWPRIVSQIKGCVRKVIWFFNKTIFWWFWKGSSIDDQGSFDQTEQFIRTGFNKNVILYTAYRPYFFPIIVRRYCRNGSFQNICVLSHDIDVTDTLMNKVAIAWIICVLDQSKDWIFTLDSWSVLC